MDYLSRWLSLYLRAMDSIHIMMHIRDMTAFSPHLLRFRSWKTVKYSTWNIFAQDLSPSLLQENRDSIQSEMQRGLWSWNGEVFQKWFNSAVIVTHEALIYPPNSWTTSWEPLICASCPVFFISKGSARRVNPPNISYCKASHNRFTTLLHISCQLCVFHLRLHGL